MSFAWTWAGTTTPSVSDMVSGAEIFDPLFSWVAIPGAASYQIEVNTTPGYAPGSRLMLLNTNATSLAPRQTLPNNTYYWRVRGVDPQGQAGPWNNGPSFDKTYDQTPAPQGPQNLRVLNTKLQPIADGGKVNEPVLEWNTVPGARAYEVSISCNGATQPQVYTTSNTAWTPFAQTTAGPPPFLDSPNVSIQSDGFTFAVGCDVLVRAFTDNAVDGTTVYGPYATVSFLYGPDVGGEPGFDNTPPDCTSSSCAGRLTAGSVVQPATGTTVTKSPVLCWKPVDMDPTSGTVAPSHGYWVSIARDANFTTIVQTAYVPESCYAPPVPLVDEATSYYWQVVPVSSRANSSSWNSVAAAIGGFPSPPPSFQHASVPPLPLSPIGGASASGPVVFRWAPVPEQVKDYTIEIAQDDSFSTILEQASTDATSYSATTTYPVGATVFWRVRANNNNSQGLAWSATSSFVQTLPVPAITTAQPLSGATFPALSWTPVDGATSYEVQDVWPDASVHVTSGIPSTAVSYTKMTGTGHGTVQVRAVFGNVKGAYTPVRDVNHTIAEPAGTKTSLINKPAKLALSISWNTKTNVKQYKVQFSRTPGFAAPFFEDVTDLASYTPTLTQQDFLDGGVMYWRVAVIDPDGNVGAFSKPKKFTLLARLAVQYSGQQAHGVHTVTRLGGQRQEQARQGRRREAHGRRRQDGDEEDEQEGHRRASRSRPPARATSRPP